MGYAGVASDYYSSGQIGRANEYYTKAYALRDHASERERLLISSNYDLNVTGDLEHAAAAFQETIALYPRDYQPTTAWASSTLGRASMTRRCR